MVTLDKLNVNFETTCSPVAPQWCHLAKYSACGGCSLWNWTQPQSVSPWFSPFLSDIILKPVCEVAVLFFSDFGTPSSQFKGALECTFPGRRSEKSYFPPSSNAAYQSAPRVAKTRGQPSYVATVTDNFCYFFFTENISKNLMQQWLPTMGYEPSLSSNFKFSHAWAIKETCLIRSSD